MIKGTLIPKTQRQDKKSVNIPDNSTPTMEPKPPKLDQIANALDLSGPEGNNLDTIAKPVADAKASPIP